MANICCSGSQNGQCCPHGSVNKILRDSVGKATSEPTKEKMFECSRDVVRMEKRMAKKKRFWKPLNYWIK